MTAGAHSPIVRRGVTIALAVVGVAVVVGLGLALLLRPSTVGTTGHAASASAPAGPVSTSPAVGPMSALSGTPAPTPGASRSAVLDLSDRSAYQFVSPTGNIICRMGPSTVRCNAKDRSWSPPAPADCEQAHDDIALGADGKATVVCHTDSIRQPMTAATIPTLTYGTAVKMGDVLCISQSNGISCAQSMTGDSIFLARERYEVNTH